MSQITSFWKAVNASVKVRVFVKIDIVTARNAQAPVGRGSNTNPELPPPPQNSQYAFAPEFTIQSSSM